MTRFFHLEPVVRIKLKLFFFVICIYYTAHTMSDNQITEQEYIQQVLDGCKRAINECCMSVKRAHNGEGKPTFTVQFTQPEWYTELSDDLQHDIFNNLQDHCKEAASAAVAEYNSER